MSEYSTGDWDQTKTRPGGGWRPDVSPRALPGLTVLAHPNPERIGEQAVLRPLLAGDEALLSRLEPSFAPYLGGRSKPLADAYISRRPIGLFSQPDGGIRFDCRETSTRVEANGVVLAGEYSFSAGELDRGIVLLLAESVVLLLHPLQEIESPSTDSTLIGASPAMVQLREEIARVADVAVPVLLHGETGTGKELVARAIHDAGPRRLKPYLGVNMGAIPTTLAAAELFGAARGAFTGADRRRVGYFQRADGGTLLLDEIGATPPEIQVMLLRVLETGEVEGVGEGQPQRVDVRVLAATDVDLESAIKSGEFRAPLLHRLSSYQITLPPLRQRREDIGRLLYYFLRRELAELGEADRLAAPERGNRPWLPARLVARIASLNWPGNVRQLLNVARQLVIASRGSDEVQLTPQLEGLLSEAAAPVEKGATPPPRLRTPPPARPKINYRDPQEVSEDELLAVLRAHRWRLKPAAHELGVSRTSLYALVERCPRVRQAKDLTRQQVETALERSGGNLDGMIDELEISRDALLRRMKELGLR